eukprot:TRINITY_DN1561_c3_g2_i1.p1 TRINITY_DN1561_c3_g2~~TRINITY_DN1561_c3_g2_i1.p1  ORF type:complete len:746 (+),score=222.86 TRINITY_DN1561_c3_g2_i1:64-2301(+)
MALDFDRFCGGGGAAGFDGLDAFTPMTGGFGDDDAPETQPAEAPDRDALLFLVDCQKQMFEPNSEGKLPFNLAITFIEAFYKSVVLRSDRDYVGLVLYATREAQNPYDFPGLYFFHTLDAPSAVRVKELRMLRSAAADFETHVGSCGPGTPFGMEDALWTALKVFHDMKKRFSTRRLLIFTSDDNPCKGDPVRREKCFARASDLYATDVTIELQAMRRGLPHQRESASPPGAGPFRGSVSGSSGLDGRGSGRPSGDGSLSHPSLRPCGLYVARGASFSLGPESAVSPDRKKHDAAPTASGSASLTRTGAVTAADLKESFDSEIFWRHLIYMACDPADAKKRKLIGLDAGLAMEDLITAFRVRTHPKRSQGRLLVQIGSGGFDRPAFAVSMHFPIRRETRTTPTVIDSTTGGPLISSQRHICKDTAKVLSAEDMVHTLTVGGEVIQFSGGELGEMRKQFGEPSIRILGFKPLARMKLKYQLSACAFLTPDDMRVENSSVAFRALWQAMLKLGHFAVAEMITRTGGAPRLYALYAARESDLAPGEAGLQSDGMYAVPLPYADDVRDLQLPPPPTVSDPAKLKLQMEKARRFVRRMRKPMLDPRDMTNPALQQHYSVLQSVALDEKLPDEIEDLTLPDYKYMKEEGLGKLFKDFHRAVLPEGYSADAMLQGVKRPPGPIVSPRPKLAHLDVSGFDFATLAASGRLTELKIPQLKAHLRDIGLPVGGVKAQLITRITDHHAAAKPATAS